MRGQWWGLMHPMAHPISSVSDWPRRAAAGARGRAFLDGAPSRKRSVASGRGGGRATGTRQRWWGRGKGPPPCWPAHKKGRGGPAPRRGGGVGHTAAPPAPAAARRSTLGAGGPGVNKGHTPGTAAAPPRGRIQRPRVPLSAATGRRGPATARTRARRASLGGAPPLCRPRPSAHGTRHGGSATRAAWQPRPPPRAGVRAAGPAAARRAPPVATAAAAARWTAPARPPARRARVADTCHQRWKEGAKMKTGNTPAPQAGTQCRACVSLSATEKHRCLASSCKSGVPLTSVVLHLHHVAPWTPTPLSLSLSGRCLRKRNTMHAFSARDWQFHKVSGVRLATPPRVRKRHATGAGRGHRHRQNGSTPPPSACKKAHQERPCTSRGVAHERWRTPAA